MINLQYKAYLQWINQVQVLRTELMDIKFEVFNSVKNLKLLNQIKADSMLSMVHQINNDLDITDYIILSSLNTAKLIWSGKYNHFGKNNINEYDWKQSIFARLKKHFTEVLNLQESVIELLSAQDLTEKKELNKRIITVSALSPGVKIVNSNVGDIF